MCSVKHEIGNCKRMSKEAREKDIADALLQSDKTSHPVGETLPIDHRVYRVKVIKTFLKVAVPLSKLDDYQELLEEHAFSLTNRRHMSDLVPFILSQEISQISEELADQPVSVIFDGTTHLGEALAMVLHFVDSDINIHQRSVRVQLLAKSMTGEEIARELIHVLSVQYRVHLQGSWPVCMTELL